jgi:UDP-glucose 4-epimerase
MKICITGSTSFIGKNLINFFIKKDLEILKINRKNFKNKNSFKKILRQSDCLIHCIGSGQVHNIDKNGHFENNFYTTKYLIQNIKELKKKNLHLIFLSSQAVYKKNKNSIKETDLTEPMNDYGRSKLMSEKLLKKLELKKITILRLFSIYGVGLKKQIIWDACNKISKNIGNFDGSGNQVRDFLNVNDLNKLIIKIIYSKKNYDFNVFNVGSGKGRKIKSVINNIKNNVNPKLKINYKNQNAKDVNFVANIEKLKNYFKWKPTSTFFRELSKYIFWFKGN